MEHTSDGSEVLEDMKREGVMSNVVLPVSKREKIDDSNFSNMNRKDRRLFAKLNGGFKLMGLNKPVVNPDTSIRVL